MTLAEQLPEARAEVERLRARVRVTEEANALLGRLVKEKDDDRLAERARAEKAEAEVAALRKQLADANVELGDWRAGAHADETGHLHRCAKINGKWSCAKGCAIPALALARKQLEEARRVLLRAVRQHRGWKKDARALLGDAHAGQGGGKP